MSNATSYLRDKILKHIVGEEAFTMPATLYLSLHTEDPTITGQVGEVTGGSYTRTAVDWAAVVSGSVVTDADTEHEGMPEVEVSHWALNDAAEAGNALLYGEWDEPKSYADGDTARIKAGELEIGVA